MIKIRPLGGPLFRCECGRFVAEEAADFPIDHSEDVCRFVGLESLVASLLNERDNPREQNAARAITAALAVGLHAKPASPYHLGCDAGRNAILKAMQDALC